MAVPVIGVDDGQRHHLHIDRPSRVLACCCWPDLVVHLGDNAMTTEISSRKMLEELIDSCETLEHYLDAVWAQRAQTTPASSTGWPYQASAGIEQPSKLRKIK